MPDDVRGINKLAPILKMTDLNWKYLCVLFLFGIHFSVYAQQPQTRIEKGYTKKHNIKSSLMTTYKFSYGKPDKSPTNMTKDFFNKNGTKTMTIIYNPTDSLAQYLYLYRYDTKGNISQISRGEIVSDIYSDIKDTIWNSKTIYKCDAIGNILERKFYNRTEPAFVETEFEPYILFTYKYDLKGNIIEEIQGTTGSPFISLPNTPVKPDKKYNCKYQYSNNGEISRMMKEISNNWTEIYDYKYDHLSNLSEEFKHYTNNQRYYSSLKKYSSQYDSAGLLIEKKDINSSGKYSFKVSYEYNDSDKEVKEITYTAQFNGKDSLMYERKYKYSLYDSLLLKSQLIPETWISSIQKDSLGRITQEILYDNKGRTMSIKEFTFYLDNRIKEKITFSSSDDIDLIRLTKYEYEFYDKK